MANTSDGTSSGLVDPETLYSRQNCIGGCLFKHSNGNDSNVNLMQVGGALGRYTKGRSRGLAISHGRSLMTIGSIEGRDKQ